MQNDLLHTPEGVRDIYGEECEKKLVLESLLHKNLKKYGYRDIQTPSFEFFDIFNKERGSVASKNMYKFFDRDNNTMVLRPDVTPSIARCAAKYFSEEDIPVKLCYKANTFINNSSYQGRLKETTQIGAELIGDGSVYADGEVLALVIECMLQAGLKEFQLELSDVAYFGGIVNESGISEKDAAELKDLIANKSYFGIEALVESLNLDKSVASKFLELSNLFGTIEVLDRARQLTSNKKALDAIDRLVDIYNILKSYGFEKYVTFDLSMLGDLSYYTGVVFSAYTYGTGDAIVKGGRYDNLTAQFGKDRPAIGFSITVDKLLLSLERQKIDIPVSHSGTMILYEEDAYTSAIAHAKEQRLNDKNVNVILKDKNKSFDSYIDYAKKNGIGEILYVKDADNSEWRTL